MVEIVNAYDENYMFVNNEIQKQISYVKEDRSVYRTHRFDSNIMRDYEIESEELRIQLPRKRDLPYIRQVTAYR